MLEKHHEMRTMQNSPLKRLNIYISKFQDVLMKLERECECAELESGQRSSSYKRPFQFVWKIVIVQNQIKSRLLSHHHSTCALMSEILESVLQTVQKNN